MPGRLFLKYDYYHGGLGDFIQGALATYAFCKNRGIEFNVYIPEHPLRNCLEYNDVNPLTSINLLYDVGDEHGGNLLHSIFDNNPSEEVILTTNACQFINDADMRAAIPDFAPHFRPSQKVRHRIASIYDTLNVKPMEYVSLHMRCGDAFMQEYDRRYPNDIRCPPMDALNKVKAAIERIRAETTLPILFHTDSYSLREMAAKELDCKILPTFIQHTAVHAINADDYYDTVAEFFILGQAETVYTIVPSGFARWSAILFDRPLVLILC